MMNRRIGWMGSLALLGVLLLGCEKKKEAKPATGDAAAATAGSDAGSGTGTAVGSGTGTLTGSGSGTAAGSAAGSAATGTESPVVAELHGLRDDACACKDAACTDAVQKKFETLMEKYKDYKPEGTDAELAGKYAEGMMECLMKGATGATPPADPPSGDTATAAPAGSTGFPSCDAYVAAMEKLATCDALPEDSRKATKDGIVQMRKAWSQMGGMPEDAKKQTDDACKQGLQALTEGARALNCAIN